MLNIEAKPDGESCNSTLPICTSSEAALCSGDHMAFTALSEKVQSPEILPAGAQVTTSLIQYGAADQSGYARYKWNKKD